MVAIQVSREGLLGKWLGAPCLFCLLTSESLNHIWIFVLLSNLTFIFCSVEKWNQYNVCVCVCVNKTYMYFKELALESLMFLPFIRSLTLSVITSFKMSVPLTQKTKSNQPQNEL